MYVVHAHSEITRSTHFKEIRKNITNIVLKAFPSLETEYTLYTQEDHHFAQ